MPMEITGMVTGDLRQHVLLMALQDQTVHPLQHVLQPELPDLQDHQHQIICHPDPVPPDPEAAADLAEAEAGVAEDLAEAEAAEAVAEEDN